MAHFWQASARVWLAAGQRELRSGRWLTAERARAYPLILLTFYALAVGVALGTWCALFALLDWICFANLGKSGSWGLDGIPTLVVIGLYSGAVLLRVEPTWHAASASAMALEVAGAGLLANKAWIGRELAGSLSIRR